MWLPGHSMATAECLVGMHTEHLRVGAFIALLRLGRECRSHRLHASNAVEMEVCLLRPLRTRHTSPVEEIANEL